jgi:hypothetical protein
VTDPPRPAEKNPLSKYPNVTGIELAGDGGQWIVWYVQPDGHRQHSDVVTLYDLQDFPPHPIPYDKSPSDEDYEPPSDEEVTACVGAMLRDAGYDLARGSAYGAGGTVIATWGVIASPKP